MYDYMPSPAEHAKACSVLRRATPPACAGGRSDRGSFYAASR